MGSPLQLRTPEEALALLSEGNNRFVERRSLHGKISEELLDNLRESQRPFAVILGCSDSRVPPELVFDQSFGDLFVIRLAGNLIAPGVAGSIQYAYEHLGTSLLVVLGHQGCGAVKAALDARFHRAKHPERIQQLVGLIEPGLEQIDPELSAAEQLDSAVEANVRWSMHQVIRAPEARQAFQRNGNVLIVGAVYELSTGKVRWLDRCSH
ncbi:MAG TPA: carbonic anhydrase [Gemmataceae bacterium]|nr:carbonic anhydrase [Gemmataceae bacterium]